MANKQHLIELAQALRALPEGFEFDMERILVKRNGHFCGCIAGLALVKSDNVPPMKYNDDCGYNIIDSSRIDWEKSWSPAQAYLELSTGETSLLFFPEDVFDDQNLVFDMSAVTAPIAADVLQGFAETGKIVWPEHLIQDKEDSL